MTEPSYLTALKEIVILKQKNTEKLNKLQKSLTQAKLFFARPDLPSEKITPALNQLSLLIQEIENLQMDNSRLDIALINSLELKEHDVSIVVDSAKIVLGDKEISGYTNITPVDLYVLRTVRNAFDVKPEDIRLEK